MQIHAAAGDIRAGHLSVWLSLYDKTRESELPEHLTRAWSALAHRIGRGLRHGLPQEGG